MAIIRCPECSKSTINKTPAEAYQETRYGRGHRVGTPKKGDPKLPQVHGCTICGTYTATPDVSVSR